MKKQIYRNSRNAIIGSENIDTPENKISKFEFDICLILAQLCHHIHPKIIHAIQAKNRKQYDHFKELFGNYINVDDYLFEGSACVFPGVRRYISAQGTKKKYNPEYKAIIDDNTLQGRKDFISKKVPAWYSKIKWNEPFCPSKWEEKIDGLLNYRTQRIKQLIDNIEK